MQQARGQRRVIARKDASGLVIGGTIVHADGVEEEMTVKRTAGGLEIVIGEDDPGDDMGEAKKQRRKAAPRSRKNGG